MDFFLINSIQLIVHSNYHLLDLVCSAACLDKFFYFILRRCVPFVSLFTVNYLFIFSITIILHCHVKNTLKIS